MLTGFLAHSQADADGKRNLRNVHNIPIAIGDIDKVKTGDGDPCEFQVIFKAASVKASKDAQLKEGQFDLRAETPQLAQQWVGKFTDAIRADAIRREADAIRRR